MYSREKAVFLKLGAIVFLSFLLASLIYWQTLPASSAEAALLESDSQIMLPFVVKPVATPTPIPPANWQISNETGGNLLAELIGYGSHVFPVGTSTWSGITPGTYSYRITSQGGPCQGQSLTGSITFSPGVTVSDRFTCTTNAVMSIK